MVEKDSIISILPLHLLKSILTISKALIHSLVFLLLHSSTILMVLIQFSAIMALMALTALTALTALMGIMEIMNITAVKDLAVSST